MSLQLLVRRNVTKSYGFKCFLSSKSSPQQPPPSSSSLPPFSWIESDEIPKSIRPYLHLARADKQAGTILLLWPCWWSIALASDVGSIPDISMMATFATGAVIMRSAGCTINDLWDMKYDKHVERTKNRPLASGALSVPQAIGFLGIQLTAGLGVLLNLNPTCIALGVASMPMVVAYPLMKRFTNWPQLFLGATFNWGALMGYTAVTGDFAMASLLPLYMGGIGWTLVYDTLYGYQDRDDDKKLGLKSTALTLGDHPQGPLTAIAAAAIAALTSTGVTADLSWAYYMGTSAFGSQLLWQIWSADLNDTKGLWARFNSNKYSGALIFASIVAGKIIV